MDSNDGVKSYQLVGKKVPDWEFKLWLRWWGLQRWAHDVQSRVWRLLHWCEHCGAKPAKIESSRTAYHWEGRGRDPNRDPRLCAGCAVEHHAYWDEMWAEHYRGRL